jgi:DNA sulfur modification protein DndB
MKVPAIRASVGTWKYYISALSFSDVSKFVRKITNELHNTEALSDMIQRSITKNYLAIEEYILSQDERFFNSLVLAVYDGDPKWTEVELRFKDEEFFNMGFLDFTGEEIIFPVDGQHRVEGIKAALKKNPELKNEKIPVIFIGHKNSSLGKQKTRRLFSTLNRYAKPVSMSDIIALDEDDIVAIVTRDLIENLNLFNGQKIVNVKGKGIPDTNKVAFTSIINLYDCNRLIMEYFLKDKLVRVTKKKIDDYLRKRPLESEIQEFKSICFSFWKDFSSNIDVIRKYLVDPSNEPAKKYRNKLSGGNLLFRPIGLKPFVKASIEIQIQTNKPFRLIFQELNRLNLNLNKKPWKQVLWNSHEKTMLRSDDFVVKALIKYLAERSLVVGTELTKLQKSYAGKINYSGKPEKSLMELE